MEERFGTCLNVDDCLRELLENGRMAVGVSRQYASSHPQFSSDEIYCLGDREHIEGFQVTMLVRRDLELMSLINKEIRRFSEAGLISKWAQDSRKRKISEQRDFIYFGIKHAMGLVLFYVLPGWLFAIIFFALERLSFAEKSVFRKSEMLKKCLRGDFYSPKS